MAVETGPIQMDLSGMAQASIDAMQSDGMDVNTAEIRALEGWGHDGGEFIWPDSDSSEVATNE